MCVYVDVYMSCVYVIFTSSFTRLRIVRPSRPTSPRSRLGRRASQAGAPDEAEGQAASSKLGYCGRAAAGASLPPPPPRARLRQSARVQPRAAAPSGSRSSPRVGAPWACPPPGSPGASSPSVDTRKARWDASLAATALQGSIGGARRAAPRASAGPSAAAASVLPAARRLRAGSEAAAGAEGAAGSGL